MHQLLTTISFARPGARGVGRLKEMMLNRVVAVTVIISLLQCLSCTVETNRRNIATTHTEQTPSLPMPPSISDFGPIRLDEPTQYTYSYSVAHDGIAFVSLQAKTIGPRDQYAWALNDTTVEICVYEGPKCVLTEKGHLKKWVHTAFGDKGHEATLLWPDCRGLALEDPARVTYTDQGIVVSRERTSRTWSDFGQEPGPADCNRFSAQAGKNYQLVVKVLNRNRAAANFEVIVHVSAR